MDPNQSLQTSQVRQRDTRRLYAELDRYADDHGLEAAIDEFDRWRAQRIDDFPSYLFSKRQERL